MDILVSVIAPVLTVCQLLPQLYKTYTTKNVKGLALPTFILWWMTSFTWLLHSYYTRDIPLMISTSISCILLLVLIRMIFLYQKN